MPKGIIRRLNREGSSGYIRTERGLELYFDRSQLQGMHLSPRLEGQQVEFDVGHSSDGRSIAMKIRISKSRS